MNDASYCPLCHRAVPPNRSTCPSCGAFLWRRYEFEQLLEEPFEELENKANRHIQLRINRMERELSRIERDLDTYLDRATRKALPRPIG